MATIEEVKQELTKAEVQLEEAKAAVRAFKEDANGGKWLDELRTKLRGNEGNEAQRAEWREEKEKLEKKEERLEASKNEWEKEVLKSREDLRQARAATQPGNDFVTRALGT